jgi:hypothetical protein
MSVAHTSRTVSRRFLMSRALASALALAGLCVGVAAAADPIKVDLKDFKWKCKFDSGDALGGYEEGEGKLFFYTFGTQTATVKIPEDGEYTITVEASCNAAEKEMAKFKLDVGDVEVAKEFTLKEEAAKSYELTAKLKKGEQKLVIEFLNDKYKDGEYDLNLYVHGVKIEPKKAGDKKEEKKEEKKAGEPVNFDLKTFKWVPKNAARTELGGYDDGEGKLFLYTFGSQVVNWTVPADGEYTITVEASCTAAEKEMAKFKLTVGDVEVAKECTLKEEAAKPYEFTATLKKGEQKLGIEFLNDKYKEGEYDLNLFVHSVKAEPKKK